MGHKTGWLTLHAGIAGGADVILLPELPYDIHKVADALKQRTENGKHFSILAVAEGAISKEDAALTRSEYKKKKSKNTCPSIAYEIADQLAAETGQEVRITIPGHTQRGGSPNAYDRVLASRLGSFAAQLILEEQYGFMVALRDGKLVTVPLEEVSGKLKTVPPEHEMIAQAKEIGICFGN